jgi:anti-sigma B factor antagonist
MGGPDATILHDKLHDLIAEKKLKVVVDLSDVDWMNSTGLGILISGLTTLRNNQGDLKLASVTDKIQSLLTITKLITVFEAYDSVDEAITSFGTAARA